MSAALAVFVVTYVVIAVPAVARLGLDRPAAALIGAVAMVVLGGLGQGAALAAVDLHVLVLLIKRAHDRGLPAREPLLPVGRVPGPDPGPLGAVATARC